MVWGLIPVVVPWRMLSLCEVLSWNVPLSTHGEYRYIKWYKTGMIMSHLYDSTCSLFGSNVKAQLIKYTVCLNIIIPFHRYQSMPIVCLKLNFDRTKQIVWSKVLFLYCEYLNIFRAHLLHLVIHWSLAPALYHPWHIFIFCSYFL